MQRYHNRLITAAEVVQVLVAIRKEVEADSERADALGLNGEEIAFYDAVTDNYGAIYDQAYLCEIIRDVVEVIRRNLKVDWTLPHREDVKAAVRAAVRRVLARKKVRAEDLEALTSRFLEQAEALYSDWPLAA